MRTFGSNASRVTRQLRRRGLPLALLAVGTLVLQASECSKEDFYDVFGGIGLTDVDGPLITSFLPVANVTLNDEFVMATITDPQGSNGAAPSGVDPASITATGDDGADLPITMAGTNMYNAGIADWGDGLHSIDWSALDFDGNEGTGSQSITIDRTAPVVTVNPPPATATSDDASFSWTVGVNIVEQHLLDAFYTARFPGPDDECGTGDDVTPTAEEVPTSTFNLAEGANTAEVVANNPVAPGGQPMTWVICGSVTARDDAVTKSGGEASNTTTSVQYVTDLTFMAPPGGGGSFTTTFISIVTDHRGNTSVICWVVGTSPAQPGATFQVVTTGPGVLTPAVSGALNANGQAAVEVGINLFGTYNIGQIVTFGANDASASTTHTVDQTEGTCAVAQSSIHFKRGVVALLPDDVRPLGLRPVAFRYREPWGDPAAPQIGLIAEEVAEVFPAAVFLDAKGRPESIHYGILTKAVVDELEARAAGAARTAIARLAEAF
jgi:hypothetical protein